MAKRREKNYKILVMGQQEIRVICPAKLDEYNFTATSPEEAHQKALVEYKKFNPGAINISASVKQTRNIKLAILFSSIACFFSLFNWFTDAGTVLSIRPSLISVMAAIAIYSAAIIRARGLDNSFNSFLEGLQSILTIWLCATFVGFFIGPLSFQIPLPGGWFAQRIMGLPEALVIPIPSSFILLLAILLSWLGIPQIARFAWVALFVLAGVRILVADVAMGIWGAMYMLTAFLGIVFMLKHEEADSRDAMIGNLSKIGSNARDFFKANLDFSSKAKTQNDFANVSDAQITDESQHKEDK